MTVSRIFLNYFVNIFTSNNDENLKDIHRVVENRITQEMREDLNHKLTIEEVRNFIIQMKGNASSGPDGLPTFFYHHYWEIVDPIVTNLVLGILNNNGDIDNINKTYICFIPKIKNLCYPSDYRLMSLCNVSLKIVSKTIANRIKKHQNFIFSPFQSAFIPEMLITYNIILTYEALHSLNKNNNTEKVI